MEKPEKRNLDGYTNGHGKFSDSHYTDAGYMDAYDQWEPLYDKLKKHIESQEDVLHEINSWCSAYPLKIFPEPDFKKAHEVLKANGMTIDAISASNMRHVLDGIKKIINNHRKDFPKEGLMRDYEKIASNIAGVEGSAVIGVAKALKEAEERGLKAKMQMTARSLEIAVERGRKEEKERCLGIARLYIQRALGNSCFVSSCMARDITEAIAKEEL